MTNLKVKFKRLVEHAMTPSYSKEGDAGLDLTAIDTYYNHDFKFVEYGTGLAVEIPEGYVGLIYPRSSISKTPHLLCNSVGVVDSNYRGELKLRFRTDEHKQDMEYMVGDRIGQLIIVPYPKVELEEVSELSNSNRGTGGFGSSGK
jgi:dUTP pyrophosphatase